MADEAARLHDERNTQHYGSEDQFAHKIAHERDDIARKRDFEESNEASGDFVPKKVGDTRHDIFDRTEDEFELSCDRED